VVGDDITRHIGFDSPKRSSDGPEIAEKAGVNYQTIQDYGSVARAFEISLRNENLTYYHHRAAMAAEVEGDARRSVTCASNPAAA
jgi:hypothetical protein